MEDWDKATPEEIAAFNKESRARAAEYSRREKKLEKIVELYKLYTEVWGARVCSSSIRDELAKDLYARALAAVDE